MRSHKIKTCAERTCENTFRQFNSLQKYCSARCKSLNTKASKKRRTPIKRVSDKRKVERLVYKAKRLKFLSKNKLCVIKGSSCSVKATTIEHSKGREGYADDWARSNGISLYVDERYFKASCLNCNLELENNPELAKKHQISKLHNGKRGRL